MLRSLRNRIAAVVALSALLTSVAAPAFAATTLHIDGSTTLYPLAQKWASVYKAAHGWSITVAGGGSGKGISDAHNGVVDIGMSSRVKSATDPSAVVFTPVSRDALAIVINPAFYAKYPTYLAKITPMTVQKIYRGQITNWNQVDSHLPSHSIDLMGRTGSSGTYSYFKDSFLTNLTATGGVGSTKYKQSSRTRTYSSNGMVRSAVAGDKYAIGYLALSYVNSKVKAMRVLQPTGPKSGTYVSATKTNALNGSYTYVRDLYFVTEGAPSGSAATFINWCKSSAGQGYCGSAGFLPLN